MDSTMNDTKVKITIPSWSKVVGLIITVIGLTITCVLWAATEHSDIKTFTEQQNYVIQKDIKEHVEDRYVPKESFSRVEQSLQDQKEDIKEIKKKIDKIFDAVHK
jgi:septal ring factor EnvC (AmiA/AmiB activator)